MAQTSLLDIVDFEGDHIWMPLSATLIQITLTIGANINRRAGLEDVVIDLDENDVVQMLTPVHDDDLLIYCTPVSGVKYSILQLRPYYNVRDGIIFDNV